MHGLPVFTVGGALLQTWTILRRHIGRLFIAGTLLYGLPVAVFGLLAAALNLPTTGSFRVAAATHQPPPDLKLFLAYLGLNVVVQLGGFVLTVAVAVRIAHDGLHGRPANLMRHVGAALRSLPAAAALLIVNGLATSLASLLLLVPGIMLFCRWSVALPALVTEGTGILGSLSRSRDLTRHHRWAILGFYALFGLVVVVLIFALAFGVIMLGRSVVAGLGLTATRWTLTAVDVAANALIVMLNGAAIAALYFELRRAGEGGLATETAEAFA